MKYGHKADLALTLTIGFMLGSGVQAHSPENVVYAFLILSGLYLYFFIQYGRHGYEGDMK